MLRNTVTLYQHASTSPGTGTTYKQQTIIEIPQLVSGREPLAAQLDRFVALARAARPTPTSSAPASCPATGWSTPCGRRPGRRGDDAADRAARSPGGRAGGHPGQHLEVPAQHVVEGEPLADQPLPGRPDPGPAARVVQQLGDRGARAPGRPHRHQDQVLPADQPDAREVVRPHGRDHGHAAGHALQAGGAEAVALQVVRLDVGRSEVVGHVGPRDGADGEDRVADAEPRARSRKRS